MILAGCLGLTLVLPLLTLARTPPRAGRALIFSFGAALGSAVVRPRLLRGGGAESGPVSVIPRGIVWLLSTLTTITFLSEGAVLEWSASLMNSTRLVTDARGGLGYMLFSVAMTTGRLFGDTVVGRIGDRNTLFWGSLLATAGFATMAAAPIAGVAPAGFVDRGEPPISFLCCSGAPALRPSCRQDWRWRPSDLWYAGILLGPAAVGFVARLRSFPEAFWMLAGLLCVPTLSARKATA
jgi:hypothetical protein